MRTTPEDPHGEGLVHNLKRFRLPLHPMTRSNLNSAHSLLKHTVKSERLGDKDGSVIGSNKQARRVKTFYSESPDFLIVPDKSDPDMQETQKKGEPKINPQVVLSLEARARQSILAMNFSTWQTHMATDRLGKLSERIKLTLCLLNEQKVTATQVASALEAFALDIDSNQDSVKSGAKALHDAAFLNSLSLAEISLLRRDAHIRTLPFTPSQAALEGLRAVPLALPDEHTMSESEYEPDHLFKGTWAAAKADLEDQANTCRSEMVFSVRSSNKRKSSTETHKNPKNRRNDGHNRSNSGSNSSRSRGGGGRAI